MGNLLLAAAAAAATIAIAIATAAITIATAAAAAIVITVTIAIGGTPRQKVSLEEHANQRVELAKKDVVLIVWDLPETDREDRP